MFSRPDQEALSRRDFLRGTTAAGLGLLTGLPALAQEREGRSPYAPFRMGIQTYSLRAFKIEDACAKTQKLGLKFIEAFPNHLPQSDDPKVIASYKDLLKTYGLTLAAYGVVSFKNDEKAARREFDFAKAMGIETLTAYPTYDSLALLDGLAEEYKINIAIHNHGPGDDLYDKIEKFVKAVEGRSVRIGSCNDTGHYLRSDEDPVEATRKFGKRVYEIHLKDVKGGPGEQKEFTELGKGRLDTVALLKTLRANRFRGVVALEYEEHEKDPIPYIEECLAVAREAVKQARAAR
jgi:sugar phosphate isomerase/epimerase